MRFRAAILGAGAVVLAGCQTISPPATLDNASYVRIDTPAGKANVWVTTHVTSVEREEGRHFVEVAEAVVREFCGQPGTGGSFFRIPDIQNLGWAVRFPFYCLEAEVPAGTKMPAVTNINW